MSALSRMVLCGGPISLRALIECPVPVDSSVDTRIWERRSLYCVLISGLSLWAEYTPETNADVSMDCTSDQRDSGEKRICWWQELQ